MQKTLLAVLMLFAVNQTQAAQVWDIMQFQIQSGKANVALEAFDELQSSEVASNRTASVQFQATRFNGSSPATHAVVVLYPSRAEQERWSTSMAGSSEMRNFQKKMSSIAKPVA
ncbi:MAG: hypothetical protein VB957_14045 [Pseudomonadales bacterium]